MGVSSVYVHSSPQANDVPMHLLWLPTPSMKLSAQASHAESFTDVCEPRKDTCGVHEAQIMPGSLGVLLRLPRRHVTVPRTWRQRRRTWREAGIDR